MVAFPTGRKSAAARLAVVPGKVEERPWPPEHLTDEEGAQWWSIVNRMPANYFTAEFQPLLAAYCQHIVIAMTITERLKHVDLAAAELDYTAIRAQNILHSMLTREHRTMAMLATRLRLTPQADIHASRQKQQTARKQEPTYRSAIEVDDSAA